MTLVEEKYNDIKDAEYQYYEIDHDDCTQEALIDPNKDGRRPIWETANVKDDIIKCIGHLRIRYANKKILSNPPEHMMGTGTIIKIDAQNRCYVLTVAHNARQPLRECIICHKRTIISHCKKCNENTVKLKPIQLVEPTQIEFSTRCIVKVKEELQTGIKYKFGDPISVHEIDQCYIPETLYKLWCSPMAGYDIAIMIFTLDNEINDKEIHNYNNFCSRIDLTSDVQFGGQKNRLFLYGYPGDKYYTTDNNLKEYQMYGMSTGMHGNKFQIGKHEKSNKLYIRNNEIDTHAGQSGSVVWSYANNDKSRYVIYCVHSGGNQANPKKGRQFGVNYGTFLDKENVKWIERIQDILSLQSSFTTNTQNMIFQRVQDQQHEMEQKLVQQLQKNDSQKLMFEVNEKKKMEAKIKALQKNDSEKLMFEVNQKQKMETKIKAQKKKLEILTVIAGQKLDEQKNEQKALEEKYKKKMEEKIKAEKKEFEKLNDELRQKLKTKTDELKNQQTKLNLAEAAISINQQKIKQIKAKGQKLQNLNTKIKLDQQKELEDFQHKLKSTDSKYHKQLQEKIKLETLNAKLRQNLILQQNELEALNAKLRQKLQKKVDEVKNEQTKLKLNTPLADINEQKMKKLRKSSTKQQTITALSIIALLIAITIGCYMYVAKTSIKYDLNVERNISLLESKNKELLNLNITQSNSIKALQSQNRQLLNLNVTQSHEIERLRHMYNKLLRRQKKNEQSHGNQSNDTVTTERNATKKMSLSHIKNNATASHISGKEKTVPNEEYVKTEEREYDNEPLDNSDGFSVSIVVSKLLEFIAYFFFAIFIVAAMFPILLPILFCIKRTFTEINSG